MKIEYPVVWHGHHESEYPLEVLRDSFEERKQQIETIKSLTETDEMVARRLKLFKPINGWRDELPWPLVAAITDWYLARLVSVASPSSAFQDVYDQTNMIFNTMMEKYTKEVMELHAKQCGCGWTLGEPNIFKYLP